jgi:hypothetical protein
MLQLSFKTNHLRSRFHGSLPTNDDVAAVTIPAGNMDMATRKVKGAFTYESQTVFLNNLFMNKSAL